MTATMKARPTTYKGVKMRSRLEAGFAQWLDRVGLTWQYEPTCLAAPNDGQWLPDFSVAVPWLNCPTTATWFFDVKPDAFMDDPAAAALEANRWRRIVEQNGHSPLESAVAIVSPGGVWAAAGRGLMRYRWAARGQATADADDHLGCVALVAELPEDSRPWHGDWWRG